MTRSQVAGDASGLKPARTSDRSTDLDQPTDKVEPLAGGRRVKNAPVPHRNEIVVVGELTGPVEPRRRADGLEVSSFRVAVRSQPSGAGADPAPPGSRDPGASGRRDILDCVVSASAVRRRLETYRLGDVVELGGSLRHRFWNTAGRVQSRYEIEVSTLKRLGRARASRSPGTERT